MTDAGTYFASILRNRNFKDIGVQCPQAPAIILVTMTVGYISAKAVGGLTWRGSGSVRPSVPSLRSGSSRLWSVFPAPWPSPPAAS